MDYRFSLYIHLDSPNRHSDPACLDSVPLLIIAGYPAQFTKAWFHNHIAELYQHILLSYNNSWDFRFLFFFLLLPCTSLISNGTVLRLLPTWLIIFLSNFLFFLSIFAHLFFVICHILWPAAILFWQPLTWEINGRLPTASLVKVTVHGDVHRSTAPDAHEDAVWTSSHQAPPTAKEATATMPSLLSSHIYHERGGTD